MQRETMMDWLGALNPEDRLPLWVISYERPGTAPLLNLARNWQTADSVNVLVRHSQRQDYEDAYPELNIVSAADDQIPNCGSARWVASQYALADGNDAALLMDDDVLNLNFLFQRPIQSGKNEGKDASGPSTKEDRAELPTLEEYVLAGMSAVARNVFEAHPRAMLGGAIKRHMSFAAQNHKTKYVLNGGVTPRQTMVYNMARMKNEGVEMNLGLFGVHGEDIGMNAEVLAAGADCFAIPSFIYDHWPENININLSTIRNADNAAELHAAEWDALQQYPVRDYLRVKRSIIDGSFEWADINWPALHRLRGTKTLRVPWDEEAVQTALLI